MGTTYLRPDGTVLSFYLYIYTCTTHLYTLGPEEMMTTTQSKILARSATNISEIRSTKCLFTHAFWSSGCIPYCSANIAMNMRPFGLIPWLCPLDDFPLPRMWSRENDPPLFPSGVVRDAFRKVFEVAAMLRGWLMTGLNYTIWRNPKFYYSVTE